MPCFFGNIAQIFEKKLYYPPSALVAVLCFFGGAVLMHRRFAFPFVGKAWESTDKIHFLNKKLRNADFGVFICFLSVFLFFDAFHALDLSFALCYNR